jgi:hypothetical protein
MKKIIALMCASSMFAPLSCANADTQSAQTPPQQAAKPPEFLYRPVRLESIFVQAGLPTTYITQDKKGNFIGGYMVDVGIRNSNQQPPTSTINEVQTLQQLYQTACEQVEEHQKLLEATNKEYQSATSLWQKIRLCYRKVTQNHHLKASLKVQNGYLNDILKVIYNVNSAEFGSLAASVEKQLLKQHYLVYAGPLHKTKAFSEMQRNPALKQAQESANPSSVYKNILFRHPATTVWIVQSTSKNLEHLKANIKIQKTRTLYPKYITTYNTQEPVLPANTNIWVHRDVDLKKLSDTLRIGVEPLLVKS